MRISSRIPGEEMYEYHVQNKLAICDDCDRLLDTTGDQEYPTALSRELEFVDLPISEIIFYCPSCYGGYED